MTGKNLWGENRPQFTGFSQGTTIKEGKRIPIICMDKEKIVNFGEYKKFLKRQINVKIKYCSMYDECWETQYLIGQSKS